MNNPVKLVLFEELYKTIYDLVHFGAPMCCTIRPNVNNRSFNPSRKRSCGNSHLQNMHPREAPYKLQEDRSRQQRSSYLDLPSLSQKDASGARKETLSKA
jgi:hypothetical protein